MVEVEDFRKKPIEELTEQQMKSRLHLLNDTESAQMIELQETRSIITALKTELNKRGE